MHGVQGVSCMRNLFFSGCTFHIVVVVVSNCTFCVEISVSCRSSSLCGCLASQGVAYSCMFSSGCTFHVFVVVSNCTFHVVVVSNKCSLCRCPES